MKRSLLLLLLLAVPVASQAQTNQPVRMYLGANGIWFSNEVKPSDLELGATGSLSLSPHISGVAGVFYGVEHSYLRGQFGPRFTITDADDRNFSVGLGLIYQMSSETDLRTQEWTGEVVVGYRPWPETMPRAIIGASGAYGFDSEDMCYTIAGRYEIGGYR